MVAPVNFPGDVYIAGELIAVTFVAPASSIPTAALQANAVTAAKFTSTLRTGRIDFNLMGARIISANAIQNLAAVGGILASDSAPQGERVNGATDPAFRVEWQAAGVQEIQLPPVVYPPDLDTTASITLKCKARMSASADTPTLTIKWFENVGGSDKGGATGALSSTLADVTRAIASPGAAGTVANVTITPGTHATDKVELYAVWAEYTRM